MMFVTVTTLDCHYLLTDIGSSDPRRLIESHFAEADVRARWWHPQSGELVVDVGAGCGSYTLPALAMGATVMAFEPDRNCFFDLYTLVLLNRYRERAFLFNCLAGSKDGQNQSYHAAQQRCVGGNAGESRLVHRLDSLLSDSRAERFDWLKVDVEGAEIEVLRGGMESIKRFRPRVLLENHVGFLPDSCERIAEFFAALGSGWMEERIVRPELGQNANWSLWTWKGAE